MTVLCSIEGLIFETVLGTRRLSEFRALIQLQRLGPLLTKLMFSHELWAILA